MSRISDFAESVAAFLNDQKAALPDKLVISADFVPAKTLSANAIYVNVKPEGYHGETIEQRRHRIRHEEFLLRLSVRSKLPESFGKADIDTLLDAMERIGDLLLNASWDDNTRCESVKTTFDEITKGQFSATIFASIKSQSN